MLRLFCAEGGFKRRELRGESAAVLQKKQWLAVARVLRQGRLLLIGTEGDAHLAALTEDVLYLLKVHEEMNPFLYIIPAQLLAYEIACRWGCDVDQPRNLAKSVTVEQCSRLAVAEKS